MAPRIDTSFFWLKRIHALAGVALFGWLVVFLGIGSAVLASPRAFDRTMVFIGGIPLITVFEIVFIALPLMLYALMELVLIYRSSANVISYNYYGNWAYLMQRITGAVGIAFVLFHVWAVHVAPSVRGVRPTFAAIQALISSGWMRAWYIAGGSALVYHLTAGLVMGLMTWGVLATRRSRFMASVASWVVMVGLWLWGARIMIAFAA